MRLRFSPRRGPPPPGQQDRAGRPKGGSSGAPWVVLGAAGLALALVGLAGAGAAVTAVGIALQVSFLVFFARHFGLAVSALATAPVDLDAPLLDTGFRPRVSVLVACKDEEAVVEGLVRSLLALEYPSDRLQLIVVDDGSSDRTETILRRLAAATPQLECIHRPPGESRGKSDALNSALDTVEGEVVVVFDGDHQPRPDVLRRLVRHFEDPRVAAVQGRCQVRNPDDSLLTRLVAIDYLAGYLVNEYGRQSLYRLPAYGGANCAVRTSRLRELGGWNSNSVTEDTDLTLRLLLTGQRVRYDVTAVDLEEGVVTLGRFWRQRYRWARGHQQAWRDYRRAVWQSPHLSRVERLELLMFLLVFHLPVLSALGLLLLLSWMTGIAPASDPLSAFVLWTLLLVGPLFELSGGLLVARADRREALVLVFFLPLFFISIALCTKAWLDALVGRSYAWVKTGRAAEAAA